MTEVTLILRPKDSWIIVERAMDCARSRHLPLSVLLIMDSHLYHYGHNDVINTGRSRDRFLGFVLEGLVDAGRYCAENLLSEAAKRGVEISIHPILEEERGSRLHQALERAQGPVFTAKTKRRLFPIFKSDPVAAALKKSAREVTAL
jgi:hypothetical protein